MSTLLTNPLVRELKLHTFQVTRLEERVLRERELGHREIRSDAEEDIGIFAGGFPSLESILRPIAQLAGLDHARRWVVAFSSKGCAEASVEKLNEFGVMPERSGRSYRWQYGRLTLVTVEGLRKLSPEEYDGVILVDPRCHVHEARTYRTFAGRNHDRPQIVANFLADTAVSGSPALLMLMTLVPPKSRPTARIAQIYMRACWRFVDPLSLRFWETEVE